MNAPIKPCPVCEGEADQLRQALINTRVALCGLRPALNLMAREVLSDIIADNIDAALRGPQ